MRKIAVEMGMCLISAISANQSSAFQSLACVWESTYMKEAKVACGYRHELPWMSDPPPLKFSMCNIHPLEKTSCGVLCKLFLCCCWSDCCPLLWEDHGPIPMTRKEGLWGLRWNRATALLCSESQPKRLAFSPGLVSLSHLIELEGPIMQPAAFVHGRLLHTALYQGTQLCIFCLFLFQSTVAKCWVLTGHMLVLCWTLVCQKKKKVFFYLYGAVTWVEVLW